ncbi:MAG: hypothetical protein ACE361_06060 [Aureliella sp.]
MICDALTKEEIFEAYVLYTSLHGIPKEIAEIRQAVDQYYSGQVLNASIDEAMIAYMDDAIVAPPDIVLPKWGASRFYELAYSASGDHRHRVCDAWFENGCALPVGPRTALVHFWSVVQGGDEAEWEALAEGQRLSLRKDVAAGQVWLDHRKHGRIGHVPLKLAAELLSEPLSSRKYLALVDREKTPASYVDGMRILVVSADDSVDAMHIIDYATQAFCAKRSKC